MPELSGTWNTRRDYRAERERWHISLARVCGPHDREHWWRCRGEEAIRMEMEARLLRYFAAKDAPANAGA